MKKPLMIALTTAALLTTGCQVPDVFNEGSASTSGGCGSSCVKDADMINTSHHAADQLVSQASYLKNNLNAVLITSVSEITDLDSSSALGLMISEQIGDRFAQHGFPVIDLRKRHDVKVLRDTGEFMLSRDIQKISRDHVAGAVLVGTYAVGKKNVIVSTRLVRPDDSRIIASYDFKLPLGPDTKALANKKTK